MFLLVLYVTQGVLKYVKSGFPLMIYQNFVKILCNLSAFGRYVVINILMFGELGFRIRLRNFNCLSSKAIVFKMRHTFSLLYPLLTNFPTERLSLSEYSIAQLVFLSVLIASPLIKDLKQF